MAKQKATMAEVREFFGEKTRVSRPELKNYEFVSGMRLPDEIWSDRVSHGIYSLVPIQQEQVQQVHTQNQISHEVANIVQSGPDIKTEDIVSREINVFDIQSFIPKVNPNYVPWGNYKDVEILIKSKEFFTLWVTGESGTGKNAMIEQICANNNRPMVRINFNRDTQEEHIVGSKTLISGSIVYEDGPAIWAAENGAVLILDELSAGDANSVLCLQNILEGGEFFVKSLNRIVKPVAGFAIIASDNTKGQGSDSGRYIGTNVLNQAFLDRFDIMQNQEYPPAKIEKQILTKAYASFNKEVDEKFVDDVCNWVQVIRRTYQQGAIDDLITTRRAIKIIKARALWFDAEKSIDYGITRFDQTTAEAFKILWDKLGTGEMKNISEEVSNSSEPVSPF